METKAKMDTFNWRLLQYAAVSALVAFLATAFFERDTANLLYIFVSIVFSLLLLAAAIVVAVGGNPRRSLAIFLMLIVFGVMYVMNLAEEC